MRRAAALRLALAAVAGLGLNLASFQAFARLAGDRRDSIRTLSRIR
jgi:hypothetical protein